MSSNSTTGAPSSNIDDDDVNAVIADLESDDSKYSDDAYIAYDTHKEVEFAITGSPKIIAKRMSVLLKQVGPVPVEIGRQEGPLEVIFGTPPPVPNQNREAVHHTKLQTGDILLFPGHQKASIQLRQLQWSAFSHVAVVLEDKNKKLWCLQSTRHAMYDKTNETSNKAVCGVFIAELAVALDYWVREKDYGKEVIVRRLSGISSDMKKQLEKTGFGLGKANLQYPQLSRLVQQYLFGVLEQSAWFGFRHVYNSNTFFCSQLVAELFIRCGLLRDSLSPRAYLPESFNRMHDATFKHANVTIGPQMTVIGFENAYVVPKTIN